MASTTGLQVIRCIEFFSGIGGMHYATKKIQEFDCQIVAAYDVNVVANTVYRHNHPKVPIRTVGIEHVSAAEIEKLEADCWLMSPPCQPFTRGGLCLDEADARSAGLLHLIKRVLPFLRRPPKYLLLENVVNFERSSCRNQLVEVLQKIGFSKIAEYLVSPLDLGIPNKRDRYYMAAIRTESGPSAATLDMRHTLCDPPAPLQSLLDYLEEGCGCDYLVPNEYLTSCKNFVYDVVTLEPKPRWCSTFTKAYGSHHVIGTGSMLCCREDAGFLQDFNRADPEHLLQGKIRFFTPGEISRLHSFPPEFSFPPTVTKKQRYRLLGNSLNVDVVAAILQTLVAE